MKSIPSLALIALVASASVWAATPAGTVPGPKVYDSTYTAPVPARLARLSTFERCETVIAETNGKRVLEYSLPEDLVGEGGLVIKLEDQGNDGNGFRRWGGPHGSARCTGRAPMTCLIRYPSLPSDFTKVESFLRRKYKGLPDVDARVEVAKIFLNPIPAHPVDGENDFVDGNGEAAGVLVAFPSPRTTPSNGYGATGYGH